MKKNDSIKIVDIVVTNTDEELDSYQSESGETVETEDSDANAYDEAYDSEYVEGYSDSYDEEYDEKSTKKGASILFLVLGWLLLAGLIVVFCLFFLKDLPFFNKQNTETTTEEEIIITYEVNANEAVNALIQEYYFAIENCDQNTLMRLVIDFSAFSDMSNYKKIAAIMDNYSNFTVYTVPGYHSSDIIAFVTCNFDIGGVNTKGLNINQFYIVNTTEGYKIDNTVLDEPVVQYIDEQRGKPDIQALYKNVYDYIEKSAKEDPDFKKFVEEYGILR